MRTSLEYTIKIKLVDALFSVNTLDIIFAEFARESCMKVRTALFSNIDSLIMRLEYIPTLVMILE